MRRIIEEAVVSLSDTIKLKKEKPIIIATHYESNYHRYSPREAYVKLFRFLNFDTTYLLLIYYPQSKTIFTRAYTLYLEKKAEIKATLYVRPPFKKEGKALSYYSTPFKEEKEALFYYSIFVEVLKRNLEKLTKILPKNTIINFPQAKRYVLFTTIKMRDDILYNYIKKHMTFEYNKKVAHALIVLSRSKNEKCIIMRIFVSPISKKEVFLKKFAQTFSSLIRSNIGKLHEEIQSAIKLKSDARRRIINFFSKNITKTFRVIARKHKIKVERGEKLNPSPHRRISFAELELSNKVAEKIVDFSIERKLKQAYPNLPHDWIYLTCVCRWCTSEDLKCPIVGFFDETKHELFFRRICLDSRCDISDNKVTFKVIIQYKKGALRKPPLNAKLIYRIVSIKMYVKKDKITTYKIISLPEHNIYLCIIHIDFKGEVELLYYNTYEDIIETSYFTISMYSVPYEELIFLIATYRKELVDTFSNILIKACKNRILHRLKFDKQFLRNIAGKFLSVVHPTL